MNINVEGDFKDNKIVKNEWISVEERLPEDMQKVIAYAEFMGNRHFVGELRYNDGHWERDYDTYENHDLGNVTHWMPLPKPPKQ